MQSNQWNVMKVALIGAVVCAAFTVFQETTNGNGYPASYLVGLTVGSAFGGAVMFGVVALIRNWFARPRAR